MSTLDEPDFTAHIASACPIICFRCAGGIRKTFSVCHVPRSPHTLYHAIALALDHSHPSEDRVQRVQKECNEGVCSMMHDDFIRGHLIESCPDTFDTCMSTRELVCMYRSSMADRNPLFDPIELYATAVNNNAAVKVYRSHDEKLLLNFNPQARQCIRLMYYPQFSHYAALLPDSFEDNLDSNGTSYRMLSDFLITPTPHAHHSF
jgi:hypothetical protein